MLMASLTKYKWQENNPMRDSHIVQFVRWDMPVRQLTQSEQYTDKRDRSAQYHMVSCIEQHKQSIRRNIHRQKIAHPHQRNIATKLHRNTATFGSNAQIGRVAVAVAWGPHAGRTFQSILHVLLMLVSLARRFLISTTWASSTLFKPGWGVDVSEGQDGWTLLGTCKRRVWGSYGVLDVCSLEHMWPARLV